MAGFLVFHLLANQVGIVTEVLIRIHTQEG